MGNKIITSIIYNWSPGGVTTTEEFADDYREANVGSNGVVKIEEHRPAGEGDKWFYDIIYDTSSVERIFNPCVVYFQHQPDKE